MGNINEKKVWLDKHIVPYITSEMSGEMTNNIVAKIHRKATENPGWHLNPSCLYKHFPQNDPRSEMVKKIDAAFRQRLAS